jgi:hypothetical protein
MHWERGQSSEAATGVAATPCAAPTAWPSSRFELLSGDPMIISVLAAVM